MNASRNGYWNTKRALIATSVCLLLLYLAVHYCLAQTLTATPGSVGTANPQSVVVHVKKADGTLDSSLIQKVDTVRIGGQRAGIHSRDPDGITITPPKLASGAQHLQLLDKGNSTIAEGELRYENGGNELPMQELTVRKQEARRDQLVQYNGFYFLVFILFISMLIPFIWAVVMGTSGSASTGNRPLGLPVGSFRAILAYSLVVYLGFYVLTSILSVSQFTPPDFLSGIVATVIGFYFGSRSGDEGEASQKTGTVRGIVRRDANHPAQGATVKFTRSADGTEPYSRISDLDGRFELRGTAPGKYKVKASLTGYTFDEPEITVAEGSDHEVEIVPKLATVQGRVTNPDGTPASGAKVALLLGGVEKLSAKTGADGKYKIERVEAADYDVQASLAPHNPSDKKDAKVTPGGQLTVDLALK